MTEYVSIGTIRVARPIAELVAEEIAPGTGIPVETVWAVLEDIVNELGPKNRRLLAKRDELQSQIDAWLAARKGRDIDVSEYGGFLRQIGYLALEPGEFKVTTANVDPEIARVAGPQLVVPVDKARYALNAANARWGSLYDALYGTDAISEDDGAERGERYNPVRGARVIAAANQFLDEAVPLRWGGWAEVVEISVSDMTLHCTLADGQTTKLETVGHFKGYRVTRGHISAVLLQHNGLHIEIEIDSTDPIGAQHAAGIKDIVLESAVTTIMDCEDSVAAVDAHDKAIVYRNWHGIMRGTLTTTFEKMGQAVERNLNPDREYTAPDGETMRLPGRSLLLIRHVGAHMLTDAVLAADGKPTAETFLDCVVTVLAAIHDLNGNTDAKNSRAGSVYIVKPKQHGPEEVALSVELFARVEEAFGLARNTLKIGIMDEERRTTLNLHECMRVARERLIFINTGFLDRTGDEIHTHMQAGPMIPKGEIKNAPWMLAYEDWNVDLGLAAGLPGHAQIGKGMWAMPAAMRAMLDSKSAHPAAGASCAWVPSPTAATLHAIHYHQVDVAARQHELASRPRASLHDILTPPLLGPRKLATEEIERELENNAQGILGYVVRWVEQGIGCSTVPDINNVGLMEDRATLRISSQHIANWLHHGLVDEAQVISALQRMAKVVDRQNAGDPNYRNMVPNFDSSIAFNAAKDLILNGLKEPNGYTEHTLVRRRREFKQRLIESA
jgi:malate synthase